MMNVSVWTWGTGAAFGRELGIRPTRPRRHHVATSLIGSEGEDTRFHFLIDAGAPCVETMIDKEISSLPDVLFITHPHSDHLTDFDKLANSRIRGLQMKGLPFSPLPVVCTQECLDDPVFGLRSKFAYLGNILRWLPIPTHDVWYSIRTPDPIILPTRPLARQDIVLPVSFKSLPVYHAFAPGACLFIFSIQEPPRKVVLSGDFESIEDRIVDNPDLKDPDLLLLDTTTIKAVGTNHSNWEQGKHLIRRWASGSSRVRVLLNHISSFEDYRQGYYDHVPTDADWKDEIAKFAAPRGTRIALASDGKQYRL